MIFNDTLENYFIGTYDALLSYILAEHLVRDDINENEQFWQDDYVNPELVKAKQKVSTEFEKEYKALCKAKEYFYLCPIGIFRYSYRTCLINSNLDEVTFLSNKLETLLNDDSPGSFLNPSNKSTIEVNRNKQIEFLSNILTQKFRLNYTYENKEFKVFKLDNDQLESELENHPDVFKDREYYLSFLKLGSDYSDGIIQDNTPISFWSYIKARLLDEKMTRATSNKEFVELLNDHNLLSDEIYDRLLSLDHKLYSKKKSITESRSKVFTAYFL